MFGYLFFAQKVVNVRVWRSPFIWNYSNDFAFTFMEFSQINAMIKDLKYIEDKLRKDNERENSKLNLQELSCRLSRWMNMFNSAGERTQN